MLYPLLDENFHDFKQTFEEATSENIIELCQKYLLFLTKYREELYKLRGTPVVIFYEASSLSKEEVDRVRQEIRLTVTELTQERNRIESLLKTFTEISGYDAAQTFNEQKYKGHDNWVLKANGLKFADGADCDRIAMAEVVETASRLRREEYVAAKQHNFKIFNIG